MTSEITLDKSRPHGTCHGERLPEDPHYRVHFWQGGRMNGKIVLLPFDSNGKLVPDDGKTAPFQAQGVTQDGKTGIVTYTPLYDAPMRAFLDAKKRKATSIASQAVPEIEEAGEPQPFEEDVSSPEDEVNLVEYLKGNQNYLWQHVRDAAKKRFHKNFKNVNALVVDLVLDEKIIGEDELADKFKVCLPKKEAA